MSFLLLICLKWGMKSAYKNGFQYGLKFIFIYLLD